MARTKATYAVAIVRDDGTLDPVMTDDLDGLDACRKWILAEGDPALVYQPISLLGEPLQVGVTMKRVAKFESGTWTDATEGDGD